MSSPLLSLILAMFPVLSVASLPPLYMDFFCIQNVTLINRADAMLLAYVAGMATGSCSRHACPAQEGRSQSATALGPAVKLGSNMTAVWDNCAAGAYPAGRCFGDWHCMFSWLNSLLCLVTMSFCLLKLREDFLLFLWLKLRCDDQRNVFSLITMQQKAIL